MLPVVSVQNVSMMFRLSRNREYRVKEYLLNVLRGRLAYEEFWALRSVSFDIQKGEVVGPARCFLPAGAGGIPGTYRGQRVGKVHPAKAHCGHHAPHRGTSAGAGLHCAVN